MSGGEAHGRLVSNLMYFARLLRAAGLPIGPGKVLDAVAAVRTVGLSSREDFYWALHAVFVNHRRQRALFDQAFHLFWRNPRLLERLQNLALPSFEAPAAASEQRLARRLAEALAAGGAGASGAPRDEARAQATLSWSHGERLRHVDFESMSALEIERAKAVIAAMGPSLRPLPTRRFEIDSRGARVDVRATLRVAMRAGGDAVALVRRRRRRRAPPLTLLCDISGSMSGYSRMLLHFAHALSAARTRVATFVFGTRLTNITRHLRERDVDVALGQAAGVVGDWHGGTRIGECLHAFNRDWSRRVLAQGAVVLLITDGLDRAAGEGLEREMERLHKSCRRLIWLNPLLRYAEFEPKALGVRAMLPHVDDFRPAHNLDSLAELARALDRPLRARPPTASRPSSAMGGAAFA